MDPNGQTLKQLIAVQAQQMLAGAAQIIFYSQLNPESAIKMVENFR
jgi:hypothetical protein